MFEMKYIIIKTPMGEKPYIFSNLDNHNEVANSLRYGHDNVVGAGFLQHTAEGMRVYGRSESLDVNNRGDADNRIINRFFRIDL